MRYHLHRKPGSIDRVADDKKPTEVTPRTGVPAFSSFLEDFPSSNREAKPQGTSAYLHRKTPATPKASPLCCGSQNQLTKSTNMSTALNNNSTRSTGYTREAAIRPNRGYRLRLLDKAIAEGRISYPSGRSNSSSREPGVKSAGSKPLHRDPLTKRKESYA